MPRATKAWPREHAAGVYFSDRWHFFGKMTGSPSTQLYLKELEIAAAAATDKARRGRNGRRDKSVSTASHRYRSRNAQVVRSEEHTSELQSPCNLVCRL